MLTGRQIHEARLLLGLSRSDLASELSIVGSPSLKRIEMFDGPPPISEDYAATIQAAFEAAGVIFIDTNGERPGVKLRKGQP